MEALQMLKFAEKQDRVNFTDGWITSQKDMIWVQPDSQTLPRLTAGNLFDDIIKLISEQEGDVVDDRVVLM